MNFLLFTTAREMVWHSLHGWSMQMQSRPQWRCIQSPIKGVQSSRNKRHNIWHEALKRIYGFECVMDSQFILLFYLLGTFPVLLTSLWARWATRRIASWAMTSMPTTLKTIWLITLSNQVSSTRGDDISQTKWTLPDHCLKSVALSRFLFAFAAESETVTISMDSES